MKLYRHLLCGVGCLAIMAFTSPIAVANDDIVAKLNTVNHDLNRYKTSNDITVLKATDVHIATSLPHENQVWSYLYLLNGLNTDDKQSDIAKHWINKINVLIKAETNPELRNNMVYGLGRLLTQKDNGKIIFSPSQISLIHQNIQHFTNDDHRIDVMRRYADIAKTHKLNHPSHYNALYAAHSYDQYMDVIDNAVKQDHFNVALLAALLVHDDKDRKNSLRHLFQHYNHIQDASRMRRIAQKTNNASRALDFWSRLGALYLVDGYKNQSDEAFAKAIYFANQRDEDAKQKSLSLIEKRKQTALEKQKNKLAHINQNDIDARNDALSAYENGDIKNATSITKKINDPIYRVKTFRMIAEKQMKSLDIYNVLDTMDNDNVDRFVLNGYTPIDVATQSMDDIRQSNEPQNIQSNKGIASNIGYIIPKDDLPNKLAFDGEMIRESIPLANNANITITHYKNVVLNSKFRTKRTSKHDDLIFIENGTVDLPQLYDALIDLGIKGYLTRTDNTYTLKRPILFSDNAGLIITGNDVDELKLSQEDGVYISYAGDFFVSDTKLTAWNIGENKPAYATYDDRKEFRPFFVGWSHSKSYIANSELVSLGYHAGKSYGISFSAGPNQWWKYGNQDNVNRPTGIMADNSIRNALYGYYSYEVDDFVITGNEYIDNIVYGVDPHDRSQRLVIGYNTAYDTQKKHGIIISREVNDSLIAGNLSFSNTGTGFMLDRDSNGTIVYGNTAFDNKQDGLTVFESDCEIIAANKIFDNHGAGIRARNSHNLGIFNNILENNKKDGLVAYNNSLSNDVSHAHRDLSLDPYDELTTLSLVNNRFESNGSGINIAPITSLFMRGNDFINQSPKVALGDWFQNNPKLLFKYNQDTDGLAINATCPKLTKPLQVHTCKFRENGILSFDGQDQLIERIEQSTCAQGIIQNTGEKRHHNDI